MCNQQTYCWAAVACRMVRGWFGLQLPLTRPLTCAWPVLSSKCIPGSKNRLILQLAYGQAAADSQGLEMTDPADKGMQDLSGPVLGTVSCCLIVSKHRSSGADPARWVACQTSGCRCKQDGTSTQQSSAPEYPHTEHQPPDGTRGDLPQPADKSDGRKQLLAPPSAFAHGA